jgi:uncharacterized protein YcbX
MKISQINIYPIKSLGGIDLSEAKVEVSGFQYDRNWMLVDQKGNFLSQRKHPEMALLQVEILEKTLLVYHKSKPWERIEIPSTAKSGINLKTTIWDDSLNALHVDKEVDKWFSAQLKINCSLVKLDIDNKRFIDKTYQINNEYVSFADSMPFLIIGQASLDNLNSRLDEPLPMGRFRTNLVFSGAPPFAEDDWSHIQIGQVKFKVTKPCARCVMTTIDQETGTKGKEPLKTLSEFRKVDGKVLFGQNLIALNEGIISVGNTIEIN